MNPCKEDKRKAETPSLSSWTLYLQAELVSGGWHPLFPEQVGEDLERDDARGQPEKERQQRVSGTGTVLGHKHLKIKQKCKCAVRQRCEKQENADDVSCFVCLQM